ncbi:hypothetical protein GCM10023187_42220 [Nibrella viscosa]|uniref:Uncharacterized protein n=1 Tax=Nibrella viscosa TaxID=1084524 RepID=A0ABP8KQS6_9BACT
MGVASPIVFLTYTSFYDVDSALQQAAYSNAQTMPKQIYVDYQQVIFG